MVIGLQGVKRTGLASVVMSRMQLTQCLPGSETFTRGARWLLLLTRGPSKRAGGGGGGGDGGWQEVEWWACCLDTDGCKAAPYNSPLQANCASSQRVPPESSRAKLIALNEPVVLQTLCLCQSCKHLHTQIKACIRTHIQRVPQI